MLRLLLQRAAEAVAPLERRKGIFAVGCFLAAGSLGSQGRSILLEGRRSKNIALGNRHRLAITSWSQVLTRSEDGLDETVKSFKGCFRSLCIYLKEAGYEGMEITIPDLRAGGYFPDYMSDEEMVLSVNTTLQCTHMKIIGSLLHVIDGGPPVGPTDRTGLDFQHPSFWENLNYVLSVEKAVGSEYVTFQISLPEEHMGTGGDYRNDENYLQLSAERVDALQRACFEHGMNFYVETHVDRISEDPQAFCKIFDYCPSYFEVNADISHYLYRNITGGKHFHRIMQRVGHTHQRMARKHGDLSSNVGVHFNFFENIGDPAADWDAKGVTYQAMDAMLPMLERGLSSRAIVAEAGPCFTVPDALALDVKLIPLYRNMIAVADGRRYAAEGNPWRQSDQPEV